MSYSLDTAHHYRARKTTTESPHSVPTRLGSRISSQHQSAVKDTRVAQRSPLQDVGAFEYCRREPVFDLVKVSLGRTLGKESGEVILTIWIQAQKPTFFLLVG